MGLNIRRFAVPKALVVAAGLLLSAGDRLPDPAPFTIEEDDGWGAFDAVTGTVGIGQIAVVQPRAHFVVRRVEPLRLDPGVEFLAARAIFSGRGKTPSGHLAAPAIPGLVCWRSWPVDGYGPSYSTTRLRVAPGDPDVVVVYYVRSLRPGRRSAYGIKLTYELPDGRVGTVTSGHRELRMHLHLPGERPAADHDHAPCRPEVESGWVRRDPRYPVEQG